MVKIFLSDDYLLCLYKKDENMRKNQSDEKYNNIKANINVNILILQGLIDNTLRDLLSKNQRRILI